MKKVRFETCDKLHETAKMNEPECHFPRPFIEKQVDTTVYHGYTRLLPFSMDPVHRFESSNSSPYPMLNKTNLNDESSYSKWSPSNDLELSMLDAINHEPKKPISKCVMYEAAVETNTMKILNKQNINPLHSINHNSLKSVENIKDLSGRTKDNNFFITRGNLQNLHGDMNLQHKQASRPTFDKENDPLLRKLEMMKIGIQNQTVSKGSSSRHSVEVTNDCSCHHCPKQEQGVPETLPEQVVKPCYTNNVHSIKCQCRCKIPTNCCDHYNENVKINQNSCQCSNGSNPSSQNFVDKKTWAIEKYEDNKNTDCKDIQKQTNMKEKREPTVSDLFKIIKLQNEQLQLLQEKVDKFISVSNSKPPHIPIQSYRTQNVDLESVNSEDHKISIGVMTSFEMVRTSTVINKDVVKCTNENAQIQCNRSQISIKEFVAKQPVNMNFLDGIAPVGKNMQVVSDDNSLHKHNTLGNVGEEKTFNELSLYNVHVDNATTPLMSPEQTLYLDVRDYSDSEVSTDHSNVGWTYYNKVMTHVNGMLQDSDMPSSASALCRATRHQCIQMQIDKTNVSVTKRVKFGDDPLGIHQPHIYAATTDTSLKMNQLAAKYLKNGPVPSVPQPPTPTVKPPLPFDMSFATRNYMERHKLIQGVPPTSTSPPVEDIPRFLDITALKRQTKLL